MEQFIEMSVSRKNNIKDYFLCFVFCIFPILIGSYLMILMYSLKNTGLLMVSIVVSAILYYISYKIFNSFNVDYEYSLVDDELRFAKIINKSKRKELITIARSNIRMIARVNDGAHNNVLSSDNSKKISLISQTNNEYYFMLASTKEGKSVCIFFEPNEKMCENLKVHLREKFFV